MSDADLSAAKRDFFSSRQKQPEQISFSLFFFIIVALARVTKRGLNVTKKGQNWRLQLQKRDDGDKEGMKRLFGGEFPGNGPPGAKSVTKEGQTGFFGARVGPNDTTIRFNWALDHKI
jgi:hypothetical protein